MRKIRTFRTWSRTDEEVYDEELRKQEGVVSCEPDDVDRAEGKSAVDLAADVLESDLYVTEASAWPWQVGAWYSRTDEPDANAPEGATHEEVSAHLEGFSAQEETQVHAILVQRRVLSSPWV